MTQTPSERPEELADLVCFSIYSAGHAFNAFYRRLLGEMGLTYPQYLVMLLLWRRDDRSVKDLGAALRLESNTLTPLLKRLETLGLIERRRDAADERVVRIRLTAAGRDLQAQAADIPRCMAEALGLSQKEIHALIGAVDRLRDRMAAAAEG